MNDEIKKTLEGKRDVLVDERRALRQTLAELGARDRAIDGELADLRAAERVLAS